MIEKAAQPVPREAKRTSSEPKPLDRHPTCDSPLREGASDKVLHLRESRDVYESVLDMENDGSERLLSPYHGLSGTQQDLLNSSTSSGGSRWDDDQLAIPEEPPETSLNDSQEEGPMILDEDAVFFIGDEVGELSLGHFDGVGDDFDTCWTLADEPELKVHKDHERLRRSVAKSICPKTPSSISPRGLEEELQQAMDWKEQQQTHKESIAEPKTPGPSHRKVNPHQTPTSVQSHEQGRRKWFTFGQSREDNGLEGGSEFDRAGNHPYSELFEYSTFSPPPSKDDTFLDMPDFDLPRAISTPKVAANMEQENTSKQERSKPKENASTDPYEVSSSLPAPDASWYRNFFGATTRSSLQNVNEAIQNLTSFSLGLARGGSMAPSDEKFYKRSMTKNPKGKPQRKLAVVQPALAQILSEEELLAVSGYRDYGNGLYEC
jgi:hypothetical protein